MGKFLKYAIWIIVALALVGGGIWAWRTLRAGGESEAATPVTLRCSETCADRGQCGTTMQSPIVPVILAGSNAPVVAAGQHDLFFPDGAQAEVRETMDVKLAEEDGTTFDHTFSRIEYLNPINDIVTGWVPNWCVERN